MTTDLFKTVLWNDGEGLTDGDLTATAQTLLARLTDQLAEHLAGGPLTSITTDIDQWGQNDDDTDVTSLIYTWTGGEAVVWHDGVPGHPVQVTAGTIFQKVANTDGDAAGFLPFSIRDSDVSLNMTDGDAANPRIDIIQVKLELVDGDPDARDFKDAVTGALTSTNPNKTRRVQATISIKLGTPGATPSYPAPDAGYALLGAILVPATWVEATDDVKPNYAGGSTASEALIRQCSVPLRVERYSIHGHEMDLAGVVNWGRDVSTGFILATGASTGLKVWCPVAGNKRIVGVTVIGYFDTTGSVELEAVATTIVGPLAYDVFDLSSKLVQTGTLLAKTAHLGHIADASPDSNPSAANGPIGDGHWACGGMAGPAQRVLERGGTSPDGSSRARLNIDGGDNSYVANVIWYLAG